MQDVSSEVDLRVAAARIAGFAGADLANLVNEAAALLAARKDKTAVDMTDTVSMPRQIESAARS